MQVRQGLAQLGLRSLDELVGPRQLPTLYNHCCISHFKPVTPLFTPFCVLFSCTQVRQGLAQLGLRSLDELVGHANYLQQRDAPLAKTSGLDLSFLTTFAGESGASSIRIAQAVHSNGPQLDDEILADKAVQDAIRSQVRVI